MSEHEPPAFPGPEMPPVLGDALRAAREETPGDAQIARLAARLPLGRVPEVPTAATVAPPSVLSGVIVGAALGVLVCGVAFLWPGPREEAPVTAKGAGDARPGASAVVAPAVDAPRRNGGSGDRARPAPVPATAPPMRVPAALATAAAGADTGAAPAETAPAVIAPEAVDTETEVHLLQRAHDALGASPAQALALAQEHATRFPGGALAQEREVVAIQALLRLGRAGEARARRDRFVTAYPGSAHRQRLEALLGP